MARSYAETYINDGDVDSIMNMMIGGFKGFDTMSNEELQEEFLDDNREVKIID